MQTSARQTSTRRTQAPRPRVTELPAIATQMADAKAKLIEDEANRIAAAEAERRDALVRQEMARVAARLIIRGRG